MNSVPSIKARLTNYAKKTGRTVQEVFTTYIIERVLYRISISKYADNFTLKGGVLLYGLYMEDFFRSTTDIDLLGIGISNEKKDMKSVFEDRQQRWKGFLKSKNVMLQISFSEVVASVKAFLFPVIESIRDNKEFSSSWNHSLKNWECEGE